MYIGACLTIIGVLLPLTFVGCSSLSLHYALYPVTDAQLVSRYIESGVRLNTRDSRGRTPLYIAALRGDEELVSVLLRAGANPRVRATAKGGETPLHVSATHGHVGIVRLLLEAGVDPNIRSYFKSTPLHHAAWMKQGPVVSLLLQSNANPILVDSNGRTALNGVGAYGNSPGYSTVVRLLLDSGIPIDTQEKNGFSPLLDACSAGSKEVVELLISEGADPNLAADSGLAPLVMAAGRGDASIIRILLSAGANILAADRGGRTAMTVALSRGDTGIVDALNGVEPERVNP